MTMVPRIHLVQKPMVKMRIETKMVQKMSMTQNLSAYRKITLHPLLSRVMPMYKKHQKHALLMRRPNNRLVGLHSTTNRSYTSIFLFFFASMVHTLSAVNLPFLSISHLLQVARYLVRYMCRMCAPLKLCDQ